MSFSIGIYQNHTLQLKSLLAMCPLIKPSTRVNRAASELRVIEAYPGASQFRYRSLTNETVISEKSG